LAAWEEVKTMQDYMEAKTIRNITEAIDEVHRELCVRKRCFPRWIRDGRVSKTDAQDRVDRLATAFDLLTSMAAMPDGHAVTSTGDKAQAASA
jgi:hypothetical protein